MIVHGRGTTRLRYRFIDLKQARAHVHELGEGRSVFFLPDEKLRFLPDSPVSLSVQFEAGELPRLLQGRVAAAVEGSGTWIELADARPLRDLPAPAGRRSVRFGCDAPVEARNEQRISCGHLIDLSAGGARIAGLSGFAPGDRIELRLLSSDGLTFRDLSYARVVWVAAREIGVEFDRADIVGRHAVAKFIARNDELWTKAWEGLHPPDGCDEDCAAQPPPGPRERRAAS